MISSPLLKQFESGDNLFFKAIRFLILLSGTLLLCFTGILELTWPQQVVLGILTVTSLVFLPLAALHQICALALFASALWLVYATGFAKRDAMS